MKVSGLSAACSRAVKSRYNLVLRKDPRTHAIIGAAMEVHRIIGPGHLEAVYHECLDVVILMKYLGCYKNFQ